MYIISVGIPEVRFVAIPKHDGHLRVHMSRISFLDRLSHANTLVNYGVAGIACTNLCLQLFCGTV